MLDLIRRYSALYLVEILGLCIMGNHFHILVKTLPEYKFADQDIKNRYVSFYGDDRVFADGLIPSLRVKLSSLSEFVREIKVGFARYYNKRHNRRGYFWGDRFKSVIVEKGETLINCLAYIDLNPVRAGMENRPEEYRWNSLGYHIQTRNKDNFLSLDFGLKEFGVLDTEERLNRYRRYVYEAGAVDRSENRQRKVIRDVVVEKERKKEFKISRVHRFRYRTRYFTDSGIIGTKEFVSVIYMRFKDIFMSKREKVPKPVAGLDGVYSLKRLAE
jgi:REP element-mobilizing transposase RayT